MKKLLVATLLLLASCTPNFLDLDLNQVEWFHLGKKAAPREAWYYVYVDDVNAMCQQLVYRNYSIRGCNVLVPGIMCTIYLQRDSSPAVKRHEEKHCEGWEHR